MKVELRANGSIQIHLTPETAIERAVLYAMEEKAQKGTSVSIRAMAAGEGMEAGAGLEGTGVVVEVAQ